MLIRNQVRCVIAVVVMSLVCCSAEKPVNVNSTTSPATQKTTKNIYVLFIPTAQTQIKYGNYPFDKPIHL